MLRARLFEPAKETQVEILSRDLQDLVRRHVPQDHTIIALITSYNDIRAVLKVVSDLGLDQRNTFVTAQILPDGRALNWPRRMRTVSAIVPMVEKIFFGKQEAINEAVSLAKKLEAAWKEQMGQLFMAIIDGLLNNKTPEDALMFLKGIYVTGKDLGDSWQGSVAVAAFVDHVCNLDGLINQLPTIPTADLKQLDELFKYQTTEIGPKANQANEAFLDTPYPVRTQINVLVDQLKEKHAASLKAIRQAVDERLEAEAAPVLAPM